MTMPTGTRIRVAGTSEGSLIDSLSAGGILVAVLLLGLWGDKKYKRQFRYKRM